MDIIRPPDATRIIPPPTEQIDHGHRIDPDKGKGGQSHPRPTAEHPGPERRNRREKPGRPAPRGGKIDILAKSKDQSSGPSLLPVEEIESLNRRFDVIVHQLASRGWQVQQEWMQAMIQLEGDVRTWINRAEDADFAAGPSVRLALVMLRNHLQTMLGLITDNLLFLQGAVQAARPGAGYDGEGRLQAADGRHRAFDFREGG